MTSPSYQRWYDRDPALKQALELLRNSPDKYQAQVALNIIMIIVEHQIEEQSVGSVDDMLQTIEQSRSVNGPQRRWYDVNGTLRSAMALLADCPEDVQSRVIPSICAMVEATLEEAL